MGKYRWTGIRVIKEMEQNSNKEEYLVTVGSISKNKTTSTKERRNKRIWNKARSGVRNRRRKRTNR